MSFLGRVELNPKVCNVKPVIKGTRIPVSVILDQIADGDSWNTIIKGYPELRREDIQAALLYASAVLDHILSPKRARWVSTTRSAKPRN